MRIGDLVECFKMCTDRRVVTGVVIGFSKKGEGGKDFVHVLCEGEIHIFMSFDVTVIKQGEKK